MPMFDAYSICFANPFKKNNISFQMSVVIFCCSEHIFRRHIFKVCQLNPVNSGAPSAAVDVTLERADYILQGVLECELLFSTFWLLRFDPQRYRGM